MRELVLIGQGQVSNRLFPNSPPQDVLVFTCFEWNFGDGSSFVPHHGVGTGYRVAQRRGHVVAEAGRERGVFCKGNSFSVVLGKGESEDDALIELQQVIRAHGGVGEDVEFLDTREGSNSVLLSTILPGSRVFC